MWSFGIHVLKHNAREISRAAFSKVKNLFLTGYGKSIKIPL